MATTARTGARKVTMYPPPREVTLRIGQEVRVPDYDAPREKKFDSRGRRLFPTVVVTIEEWITDADKGEDCFGSGDHWYRLSEITQILI